MAGIRHGGAALVVAALALGVFPGSADAQFDRLVKSASEKALKAAGREAALKAAEMALEKALRGANLGDVKPWVKAFGRVAAGDAQAAVAALTKAIAAERIDAAGAQRLLSTLQAAAPLVSAALDGDDTFERYVAVVHRAVAAAQATAARAGALAPDFNAGGAAGRASPAAPAAPPSPATADWIDGTAMARLHDAARAPAGAGVLYLESEPSGARVWLDGADRGSTPLTLRDVPAGYHALAFAAGTHLRADGFVHVADKEVTRVSRRLQVSSGALTVLSDPMGARVVVAGTERGTTPLTVRGLTPGKHAVELAHPGLRWTGEATVEGGGVAVVDAVLVPAPEARPPAPVAAAPARPARARGAPMVIEPGSNWHVLAQTIGRVVEAESDDRMVAGRVVTIRSGSLVIGTDGGEVAMPLAEVRRVRMYAD